MYAPEYQDNDHCIKLKGVLYKLKLPTRNIPFMPDYSYYFAFYYDVTGEPLSTVAISVLLYHFFRPLLPEGSLIELIFYSMQSEQRPFKCNSKMDVSSFILQKTILYIFDV